MIQNREKSIIASLYPDSKAEMDDCYLLENNRLITTDTMAENVHFRTKWSSPEEIAAKLLHVNLSDIIASGGRPEYVFLNLGIPSGLDHNWLSKFSRKIKSLFKDFNLVLAGGDTYKSEKINLTITMIGSIRHYTPRKNAAEGEFLYITGPVGYSLLGYKFLHKNKFDRHKTRLGELSEYKTGKVIRTAVQKHLAPKSQGALMAMVHDRTLVSAAIDISDGLYQDVQNLAEASGKGFKIEISRLPDFNSLTDYLQPEEIITSGEELQILFTSETDNLHSLFPEIALIGEVTGSKPAFFLNGKPFRPKTKGYLHFN